LAVESTKKGAVENRYFLEWGGVDSDGLPKEKRHQKLKTGRILRKKERGVFF